MSISVTAIPILKDNYVWTLIDHEHKTALIVDPGVAKPVMDFLNTHQLTLSGILVTHHHDDHTGGIKEITNACAVPVISAKEENISGTTQTVNHGDTVKIGNFPINFEVIAIPGHTLHHIAYYSPGKVFCGDTLFGAGCGRLFEGTAQQLYASLCTLSALPVQTHIYCTHEYTLNNLRFAHRVEPGNKKIVERIEDVSQLRSLHIPSLPSLLSDELQTNPFLRCDSPEIIQQAEHYAGMALNTPLDVFTILREWKDEFV